MSEQTVFTAEQVREGIRRAKLIIERSLLAPRTNANFDSMRRDRITSGGSSFGGARDYYTVLGYPEELKFEHYETLYERGGMAGQIVDLPATDSWSNPPKVSEKDDQETEFVLAWEELVERLHIWEVLRRADELSGIGRYGVIVFGLAGDEKLIEPVEKGSIQGPEQLLYLRPFSEGGASISRFDEDPHSPRCGYPLEYDVQLTEKGREAVHYTRVLHVAEGDIFGRERLKRPYNTVSDLMYKVLGGSAETYWLNQRSGMHVSPKEGYDLDLDDTTVVSHLTDQFEAWAHDLVRVIIDEGTTVENIGGATVPDPSSMFSALLDDIAATTRIPKRVLLGSAAGELAAAKEDRRQWASYIAGRQTTYVEPRIFRPFINILIWYGVLPEPADGYEVGEEDRDGIRYWPSILTPDGEQLASIAMRMASAAKQYADPATGLMPITKKEQRVALGQPAEVPDDMVDDEPETPPVPAVPAVPAQPEQTPAAPGPEIVEPPPDEPDEETEQARINALFTAEHKAVIVQSICPLCGFTQAESYEGHGPLLRCANYHCRKTYDPTVEGTGQVMAIQEDNYADA